MTSSRSISFEWRAASTSQARKPSLLSTDALREKIVGEILSSEKSYIDSLNILLKCFFDSAACNDILSAAEISQLFGDIKSIRLTNQVLYDRLVSGDVVDAFLQLTPFLKTYSAYALNFTNSQKMLQQLYERPQFRQWCDAQENKNEVRGLKLPALLIMPIQRIPRYKLLLEELLKFTSAEHPDYAGIESALAQVKSVADAINARVDDFENVTKMLGIQRLIGEKRFKVVVPGRKFIKEGVLKKVTPRGRLGVERMLWLFNDVLIYARPVAAARELQRFTCCCVFPLRHCVVQRIPRRNFMQIVCQEDCIVFGSVDPHLIDAWIVALSNAIESNKRSRATLAKESSLSSPLRRAQLTPRRASTLTRRFEERRKELKQVETSLRRTTKAVRAVLERQRLREKARSTRSTLACPSLCVSKKRPPSPSYTLAKRARNAELTDMSSASLASPVAPPRRQRSRAAKMNALELLGLPVLVEEEGRASMVVEEQIERVIDECCEQRASSSEDEGFSSCARESVSTTSYRFSDVNTIETVSEEEETTMRRPPRPTPWWAEFEKEIPPHPPAEEASIFQRCTIL